MKPIFKLPKWVPIPQPVSSEDGSRKFPNNVDWCDYWIGLANNPSRGVVEFLIEEIEDYVLFNDNEYFESIDFWRGVSASSKMIEYLLLKWEVVLCFIVVCVCGSLCRFRFFATAVQFDL